MKSTAKKGSQKSSRKSLSRPLQIRRAAPKQPFKSARQVEAVRLELTQAVEQQTATSEILGVIASSPTDVQPVFDVVAEHAARLCDANNAQVFRLYEGTIHRVASYGPVPPLEKLSVSRELVAGRAIVNRRTIHVHDLGTEADTEFPNSKIYLDRYGTRTVLATPLLREEVPIGVVLIRRLEVRPFTDKQIALLKTFADQAVFAIETVRLFQELQARIRDLTEALEQQTATSEMAISLVTSARSNRSS